MIENEPLTISNEDIAQANQLSLNCPICASAVEKNMDGAALTPVICRKCSTLYHKACWEQSGGKCAILGCGHQEYLVYGQDLGPVMRITYSDLPADRLRPVSNGYEKRLKAEEKRRQQDRQRSFWADLFKRLLRAIRILD